MSDQEPIDMDDPEYDDPIVAEIRRIRTAFSEQFNGDMDAMYRHLMEERVRHPIHGMISASPSRGAADIRESA